LKELIALFIISPFLALIQSLKHYRNSWAKNGVWLFVIFYGFTMARPEAMDSSRYVLKLQNLYNSPISLNTFLASFYNDEGGKIDIYEPTVIYLLSLITANANILFAVFGVVFGYFYSRNIWLLIDQMREHKMTKNLMLLLISFSVVIGFWELNGVRMWTAAHIFFYGAFLYFVKGHRKGVLIAASSVLVHFSFMLPVGLLFFYTFVKIPWKLSYFFYMFSFFIAELNIGAIQNMLLSRAPEFLLPKVNSYLGEEFGENVRGVYSAANWYVVYYQKSMAWFLAIMFSIIYFTKMKSIKSNKALSMLFGFSLLFLAVGNVVSQIPSGGRFLLVAQLFGLTFILVGILEFKDSRINSKLNMVSPLLIFYIIVSIRMSFNTITVGTVMTNPVIAFFAELPIPLINLIK